MECSQVSCTRRSSRTFLEGRRGPVSLSSNPKLSAECKQAQPASLSIVPGTEIAKFEQELRIGAGLDRIPLLDTGSG